MSGQDDKLSIEKFTIQQTANNCRQHVTTVSNGKCTNDADNIRNSNPKNENKILTFSHYIQQSLTKVVIMEKKQKTENYKFILCKKAKKFTNNSKFCKTFFKFSQPNQLQ